jgi:hypothetical protein
MRTANDMTELGAGAVLIQDALGRIAQHLIAETFVAHYPETGEWKPYDRPDAWWDARMTMTIDPNEIRFPVTVIWEADTTRRKYYERSAA